MEPGMVTIVAVPRDHFSDTRESLESIFAHADVPFKLVYVDGGSPRPIARYLQAASRQHGFRLIRRDHYLSPNRARNIGADGIDSRYIVFIDNDVVAAPGWLGRLIACAEETGADVVGPLYFETKPLHRKVHFAGGEARIEAVETDGLQERHLIDTIHKTNYPAMPFETGCAEFHCMLVRTAAFRAVGGLDETIMSTRENIDLCLAIGEHGGKVYIEPRAHVTYLPPLRMAWRDLPFFAIRWSDDWDRASFNRLREKWNLTETDNFKRELRNLGWRRRGLMMRRTVLRWLPSSRLRVATERALLPLEKRINRAISRRYARKYGLDLAA